jgi:hypothetical protein
MKSITLLSLIILITTTYCYSNEIATGFNFFSNADSDKGTVILEEEEIELIYFNAVSEGGNRVTVSWLCSENEECNYFILERSFDDEVWEFVAEEIYDIDNSSEEFTVIDMASLNGDEVLYRLIQMNKDGARYIHQKAFLEFISPTGSLELKDEIINIKA